MGNSGRLEEENNDGHPWICHPERVKRINRSGLTAEFAEEEGSVFINHSSVFPLGKTYLASCFLIVAASGHRA
jgi:hypothetical protein